MKDYSELHQRDVLDIQDAINYETKMSDDAQRALALHDNLMTLGCMNDFLLLIDLIDLDEVRYREIKDKNLTPIGKMEQSGADKFRKRLKRIVTGKRDELINMLKEMEEETNGQKFGSDHGSV